jgi:hypothetical protein
MTPEALIASMLPPEEFGIYYAVGTNKRTQGQAFSLRLILISRATISIWKVLKPGAYHILMVSRKGQYIFQLTVFLKIFLSVHSGTFILTTADGKVLELTKSEFT